MAAGLTSVEPVVAAAMLRPLSPGGSRVWETLYSQHDSLFADKVRLSSCIGTQAPCVCMLALAIDHSTPCGTLHVCVGAPGHD